jgi:hypothetical protein
MYAVTNFRTGKALREAIKASVEDIGVYGAGVPCYQPGPFGTDVKDGDYCCEGPHYPEPHKWYVRVKVVNGRIVKAYTR